MDLQKHSLNALLDVLIVKNDIRDVGSTADLVMVFLVHVVHWYPLVPTGAHWYPLVPTFFQLGVHLI